MLQRFIEGGEAVGEQIIVLPRTESISRVDLTTRSAPLNVLGINQFVYENGILNFGTQEANENVSLRTNGRDIPLSNAAGVMGESFIALINPASAGNLHSKSIELITLSGGRIEIFPIPKALVGKELTAAFLQTRENVYRQHLQ